MEIHSNLFFNGQRIRQLVAAVVGDEPLRKAEGAGTGGSGVYRRGAGWAGRNVPISVPTVQPDDIEMTCIADGTITSCTMLGVNGPGSAVIDVWKGTLGAPPTSANSITAAAKPTITAAQNSLDTTLTGWTVAVLKGDLLRFHLVSCSTFTNISIELEITP